MARAYEKAISRAQASQEAAGRTPERTTPRTREEIESFVKGFGMSAAATRRMVDEWHADQDRAYSAGWEARADGDYYNAY